MLKYIWHRLLQIIPVIIGSTLLIYALVFLLPGDPVRALFGDKPPNPVVEAAIKREYNLDQPFIIQYLIYLKNLFVGNFGTTLRGGRPVAEIIAQSYPVTIKLALMAFVIEAFFGLTLGVISGLQKGKPIDFSILFFSLLLIAVPSFVLGFFLQFTVGIKWGILPPTAGPDPGFFNLLMPAIVLAGVSVAFIVRLTRNSISETSTADFVRTATAKGLPRKTVISHHILRNSLIVPITYLGADIGALMGGAIITERVFNINGIGFQLFQGILRGEPTLVVSIVSILVLVYIFSNLLVDILYAVLDPRLRY